MSGRTNYRADLHPLQWGTVVGLSGLYCLWDFLRSRERLGLIDQQKIEAKLLRIIMKAAHELGSISNQSHPRRFDQHSIQATFAQLVVSAQLPYVAADVRAASLLLNVSSMVALARIATSRAGALIVHLGDGDDGHWNLVAADAAGNLLVRDSEENCRAPASVFDAGYIADRRVSRHTGLMILRLQ